MAKLVSAHMNEGVEKIIGDMKPGAYAREALDNWVYVKKYSLIKFQEILTENERNFLNDLYNSHLFSPDLERKMTFDIMVDDAYLLDLPEKWEVDIEEIKRKIDNDLDAYMVAFLAGDLLL